MSQMGNTTKSPDSQKLFMATMLGMSWQLAIIVLVPIFGGYKLDTVFKTSPVLTLIGLALAMIGMVLIVRRSIKELNKYMMTNKTKESDTK
jgi:F0F1-type ATP synthase assembly protein I